MNLAAAKATLVKSKALMTMRVFLHQVLGIIMLGRRFSFTERSCGPNERDSSLEKSERH